MRFLSGRERRIGSVRFREIRAIAYRMDRQKRPTVEHRELYSSSWDKP